MQSLSSLRNFEMHILSALQWSGLCVILFQFIKLAVLLADLHLHD